MDQSIHLSAPSIPRPFHVHHVDVPRATAAGVELLCVTFDFGLSRNDRAFDVLSEEERARADRFLRHEDAIRFATTRVVLRHVLAQCTGLAPGALRFALGVAGRPQLTPPDGRMRIPLDFNVSHSGNHALIGLAAGRRVGVDIEARRPDLDWQALSKAVFAPPDEAYVDQLPAHLRLDAFYDVWTAKEALLKAAGTGIGRGLTWFSVAGGKPAEPYVRILGPGAGDSCDLTTFDAAWGGVSPGYAACVAWSK